MIESSPPRAGVVPRILVADGPPGIAMVRAAMGRRAIVWGVSDSAGIEPAMDRGVDLVLCAVHFDGSRMLQLLERLKQHPRFGRTPFVGFHTGQIELSVASAASLRVAGEAVGVAELVDLTGVEGTLGPAATQDALARTILRHLGERA